MKVCSVCKRCYDDSAAFCAEDNHRDLSETPGGGPEMIAGYRLEQLAESGVNSETYRARQLASGQSCLIRVLPSNENIDELLREARLAATLFHPNIVDTYDFGTLESGGCYIVQEDPEGRTLREFLKDVGRPELLTSIEIVRQIAEALHSLHLSGLKHGAIRPENIVLTTDHERKLLVRIQNADFGGAMARAAVSNKFLIDSALNQLRYFSPEQCSGADTSAQTDVYSLGIVFYELLAGAPPFDASKAVGIIEKHKSQRVPDIRIDNFHLRMLVTHSLMETLQKQPRLRQSSANVFARQLRHIEQLATHVSTPPPATAAPAWRPLQAASARAPLAPQPSSAVEPLPVMAMPTEEPKKAPVYDHVTDLAGERLPSRTIESEPAAVLGAASSRIETEAPVVVEPVSEPATVSDDVQIINFQEEIEPPVTSVEALNSPAAGSPGAKKSIYLTPRSRLKLWRKKLQSLASSLTPEVPPAQVTSIFDSVDRKILERQSGEQMSLETEAIDVDKIPARANPKKVEWETPDDDIPSEAAVLQLLATEGEPRYEEGVTAVSGENLEAPVAQKVQREIEAPLAVDVPATKVNKNEAVPVDAEKAFQKPIVAKLPEERAAAAVASERTAAAEIPTVSQAPSSIKPPLADSNVTTGTSATPPVEKATSVPALKRPAKKNVPTAAPPPAPKFKVAEPAVASSARAVTGHAVEKVSAAQTPKSSRKRSGIGFKVNLADLEEITHVRPPSKRIRVDWERVMAQSNVPKILPAARPVAASHEVAFVPTILGAASEQKIVLQNSILEMFSAFSTREHSNEPGRYHSITLGIGVIALVGLFLFGFSSVTNYYQASSSADSAPASQTVVEASGPPQVQAALPAIKIATKNPAKASAETKPAAEANPVPESSAAKERPAAASEKLAASKKLDAKSRPDTSKSEAAKSSVAAGAKAAAKAAPQKKVLSKSPAPTVVKAKDATRPRIVQNAKP